MIRRAVLSDREEVIALNAMYWEDNPLPYAERGAVLDGLIEVFDAVVGQGEPGICLVAPSIGIILFRLLDGALSGPGMYVRRDKRGGGIGGELLEALEKEAVALRAERIFFTPLWGHAVDWFEERGYSPVQVVMVKEL